MNATRNIVAAIAEAQRTEDWRRLDELVTQLPRPMTEEQLPALLRSLPDNDEFTEVIFGVVHAAESAETTAYARSLVQALPDLVASSPWWAETLLKRVMNSPATFAALLDAAGIATHDERRALLSAADSARQSRPERFEGPAAVLARRIAPRD